MHHKFFKFAVQGLVEEYFIPRDIHVVVPPAKDLEEVARIERTAAAMPPVSQERLTGQEHYERGITRNRDGQHESAIIEFNEAIRLDPNNVSAFWDAGTAS